MVIGWYVHHAGAGHRTRAGVVAAELRRRGHRVVLLGSGLEGPDTVDLTRDDDGTDVQDPAAGGALHWLPMAHEGTRQRMRLLAAWMTAVQPAVLVVDVSVEVTVLARLLGVPTVVVGQPGDRDDEAHRLAYRCATAVLAPWPTDLDPCPVLREHARKVSAVGGISRWSLGPSDTVARTGPNVVLTGADDPDGEALLTTVRGGAGGEWVLVGGGRWVEDLAPVLAAAPVVVTHAGQNAVADVAALGAPAVLVPRPRPHDEQRFLAEAVGRQRLCPVLDPGTGGGTAWADAVRTAREGPVLGERWGTAAGPVRAADVVEQVGRG